MGKEKTPPGMGRIRVPNWPSRLSPKTTATCPYMMPGLGQVKRWLPENNQVLRSVLSIVHWQGKFDATVSQMIGSKSKPAGASLLLDTAAYLSRKQVLKSLPRSR